MQFAKVALLGVGLLGGSLGRALRKHSLAREVVGFVRRETTARECETTGATDATTQDLVKAVTGAELIVFCTPVSEMSPLARRILSHLAPKALVTDVGSVKVGVVAELEPIIASAGGTFIGSHPMAGSEKTGVLASRSDLFEGATCVLTPTGSTPPETQSRLQRLWESVGAHVLVLPAELHDLLVAQSSHLPHIVACLLSGQVLDDRHPPELRQLCATGFKSTTRLASGSPEMWRDIVLGNRRAIAHTLAEYQSQISNFQALMDSGNPAALLNYFQRIKTQRDQFCASEGSVDRDEPRSTRP